jgi:hypothetical protein
VTALPLRAQNNRTPVLVELFTSEGCSSCPPADALLARLLQSQPVAGAEIIVLEEHVDYWESLGWHDRFSAHQFTDRQSQYGQRLSADDYTPQMVVDGNDQFVGNDGAHAMHSIAQAARKPKLALMLSPMKLDGGRITGSVSLGAGSAGSGSSAQADLYAAVVESMASTDVRSGENGGRTLHHVSVVRSLEKIGSLKALANGQSGFSLRLPQTTAGGNVRVVVFAQTPGQGAILAAASSPDFGHSAANAIAAR